jgi:inhibitor of cysteine peptidase
MVTFTESDNGAIKEIGQGSRFAVILNENPTTGYQWNATVSSGLEIQSVEYRQNDAPPGMTGVGGKRTWILVAKDAGNQKFSGVYKRSWELSTGNETAFAVNVNVVKL